MKKFCFIFFLILAFGANHLSNASDEQLPPPPDGPRGGHWTYLNSTFFEDYALVLEKCKPSLIPDCSTLTDNYRLLRVEL
jgi:hypothetical protein